MFTSMPRPAGSAPRPLPWLKSYPAGVVWDAPLTPRTISDVFERTVEAYGPRTCTVFMGRSTTYREIKMVVDQYAAGFTRLGVVKGTRVGLCLPNTPTYLVAYLAAMKLGAVIVPYNPLQTVDALAAQVSDSGTALMVTIDLAGVFEKVEALLATGVLPRAVVASFQALLPSSKSVLFRLFRAGQLADTAGSSSSDRLVLENDLTANDGYVTPATVTPADLAVLQYTGGTTGTPKAAMLSHANLTVNVQQLAAWSAGVLQDGQERILAVLPFFHVFALTGVVNFGLTTGAEIVIQPRFVLDETLKLIAKTKPTVMPGVPTLFGALAAHKQAASLDAKSLKLCLSGGAPLPVEVAQRFDTMTNAKLVEAYGLSETAPGVTCNLLDGRAKAGSIGLPLPGTTVSIRDPAMPDREMPLGQLGEICVSGPQVMGGYWQRPEETAAAFAGAFFRTGDIGYIDQDGFVFIIDRIKDVIISSGFKVYPRHVEEKLYQHPAVEEATVIGISDAYRGETPKAFVKLKAGASVSADDLRRHLETRLSKIEMPTSIELRDTLPKSVIGKLSKKELTAEEAVKLLR